MNWPQAPYKTKADTDANFKRMLVEGFKPENLQAVRLGIASHNLFEVSFALILAVENNALEYVQFEMLEGMANHQRRALFEICQSLLLYAPACRREDFIHAIGYLVRRLDENTGAGQFPAARVQAGGGQPGLAAAGGQVRRVVPGDAHGVRRAAPHAGSASAARSRRWGPIIPGSSSRTNRIPTSRWRRTRSGPRNWWRAGNGRRWNIRPSCRWRLPGRWSRPSDQSMEATDPSRPGVVIGRYRQANEEDIERAVACAKADEDGWRTMDEAAARGHPAAGRPTAPRRAGRPDGHGAGRWRQDAEPNRTRKSRKRWTSSSSTAARRWNSSRCRVSRRRRAAWSSSSRPGISRSPFRAAGWRPRWPPATRSSSSRPPTRSWWPTRCASVSGAAACRARPCSWCRAPARTGGKRLVSHDDVDIVILTGGTDTAVQHAQAQAATAAAGRDGREERHDRHDDLRPRSGHQARAAFRVQPRRPEVLRHVAADPGRGSLRRRGLPQRVVRCGGEHSGRIGVGPEDQDGPADSTGVRRAGDGAQGTGSGRVVGRHAALLRREPAPGARPP